MYTLCNRPVQIFCFSGSLVLSVQNDLNYNMNCITISFMNKVLLSALLVESRCFQIPAKNGHCIVLKCKI